ncbi:hypothetical protein HD554DRAFT_2124939 [Boletus coccyginus]|nr:hypothetical protein HD554DRAFT_2124939 [Boletus coccyginus]
MSKRGGATSSFSRHLAIVCSPTGSPAAQSLLLSSRTHPPLPLSLRSSVHPTPHRESPIVRRTSLIWFRSLTCSVPIPPSQLARHRSASGRKASGLRPHPFLLSIASYLHSCIYIDHTSTRFTVSDRYSRTSITAGLFACYPTVILRKHSPNGSQSLNLVRRP